MVRNFIIDYLGKISKKLEICICRRDPMQLVNLLKPLSKHQLKPSFLKVLMKILPLLNFLFEFYLIFRGNLVKNLELCKSMEFYPCS